MKSTKSLVLGISLIIKFNGAYRDVGIFSKINQIQNQTFLEFNIKAKKLIMNQSEQSTPSDFINKTSIGIP